MKIGIDCRAMSESGGIGEYTRQLTKELVQNKQDKFVLFFADSLQAEKLRQDNVEIKILPFCKYKKFLPLVYTHLLVPLFIKQSKCDVVLFPANIIPLFWWGKSVVVVHDLAVYKLPELFPEQKINLDRRLLVPCSLRRATKIIAVSEHTKKDIVELFKIPAVKISVVYEGGDGLAEFPPPFQGGARGGFEGNSESLLISSWKGEKLHPEIYFLFIGTVEPRKNLVRLVGAYKNFVQETKSDLDLVLAGKSGWKNSDIFEAIKSTNQELGAERIKYLGFISDEEKIGLYQNAYALVMPSIYEGFGLPVAEALQFGLPQVLADNSSLPEVGGGVAIYVDPQSENSIKEGLVEISSNSALRDQLAQEASLRAPQFTWQACAQGVLEALESVERGDKSN